MVEFAELSKVNLDNYSSLSSLPIQGTLGLITLNGDVFLCVVTGASQVASVRPDETALRIYGVEFRTYLP
jgi:hypothetical protein